MLKIKSLLISKLFINFIFIVFCLFNLPLEANFFSKWWFAGNKNGENNSYIADKSIVDKDSHEKKVEVDKKSSGNDDKISKNNLGVLNTETKANIALIFSKVFKKSNIIVAAKITALTIAVLGLVFAIIKISRRIQNNGFDNPPNEPEPEAPVVENEPIIVINDPKECILCAEDRESTDFHKMSCCGFELCLACLNNNIVRLAIKEKNMDYLKCPNPQCKREICMGEIKEIVKNDQKKFDEIDNVFLEKSLLSIPGIRRCPTDGCNNCFENDENIVQSRRCEKCMSSYCANCLINHNRDISCQQAIENKKREKIEKLTPKELKRLKKEEEETAKIVRPCPGCRVDIHRTEGCRAMRCTNCKTEFCWNCLEIVGGHTYDHDCPKAPKGKGKNVFAIN